jgi:hypothetical protein
MNDPDATSHRSMMWQEDTIAPSKINGPACKDNYGTSNYGGVAQFPVTSIYGGTAQFTGAINNV